MVVGTCVCLQGLQFFGAVCVGLCCSLGRCVCRCVRCWGVGLSVCLCVCVCEVRWVCVLVCVFANEMYHKLRNCEVRSAESLFRNYLTCLEFMIFLQKGPGKHDESLLEGLRGYVRNHEFLCQFRAEYAQILEMEEIIDDRDGWHLVRGDDVSFCFSSGEYVPHYS